VHYLSQPGLVDLSSDVDFGAVTRAARAKSALVSPCIGQGDFLLRMGAVPRLERLINADSVSDAQAADMVEAFKRLVEPEQMGLKYKALAIMQPGLEINGFPDPEEETQSQSSSKN
jgi:SAM-dependent MidA family methyltransferase